MILVKDDIITVDEYLKRVSLRDIQGAAKLDRQNDASELIDLSYNTGRLHDVKPAFSDIQAETVFFRHSPTHTYKIAHIFRLVKSKKRQKLQDFYIL